MAAPNDGYGQYPPQQYDQEAPYTDPQAAAGYEGQPSPPPQGAAHHDAGKKKKRGYATQAFEFGSGANAGATAPPPGGMPPAFGAPGQAPQPSPGYPAYPGQDFQQPGYGSPAPAAPSPYGAPQPGMPAQPGVVGYQAPDAYYPSGPGPLSPGVAGITQGMAGMNVGPSPQPGAQQAPHQARVALNQLYPTDLLNQPFNVSELDLPPPPCILPPNVSLAGAVCLMYWTPWANSS